MWYFDKADDIMNRFPGSDIITFETGYGPSGKPHVGTIGEIIRTSFVRYAFSSKYVTPTRLICVSDDLDALRKVPTNVDLPEMMVDRIGYPLCDIPSPYREWPGLSFSAANISMLIKNLQYYGFNVISGQEAVEMIVNKTPTDITTVICVNASDLYRQGVFNAMLSTIAGNVKDVSDIVTGTLGDVRKQTYCPFMPIDEKVIHELSDWEITPDYQLVDRILNRSYPILNGGCKLQWKVDWCMRWMALGVNFEMHGKDLMSSADVGSRIVSKLGRNQPILMRYELFLDESGKKIAKSIGNGVELEDWQRYGIDKALHYYLAQNPTKARKITEDTITQTNDQLIQTINEWEDSHNEVWVAHFGSIPAPIPVSFNTVSSIVNLTGGDSFETVFRMIKTYHPEINEDSELIQSMINSGLSHYHNVVKHRLSYHTPNEHERMVLVDLCNILSNLDPTLNAEQIQYHVYECGKKHYEKQKLREFFELIYKTLLGTASGPRLGTLAEVLGLKQLVQHIQNKL